MPAKPSDNTQPHELQVAEQALCSLLDFFADCGLSSKNIRKVLDNASSGRALGKRERGGVRPLERAGQCLQRWHTSARYTDDSGLPVPLSETGPISLYSLAVDCGHTDPADSIQLLKGFRLIDRKANTYLPKARIAKTPRTGLIPLWYGCEEITRSLSTLTNNMRSRKKSKPLVFQRTANQIEFNREHLPLFRRFVDDQGGEFIQMIDDWMDKHRCSSSRGDSVHASVHAFAWIDERKEPEPLLSRRSKKRAKIVKAKNRNA